MKKMRIISAFCILVFLIPSLYGCSKNTAVPAMASASAQPSGASASAAATASAPTVMPSGTPTQSPGISAKVSPSASVSPSAKDSPSAKVTPAASASGSKYSFKTEMFNADEINIKYPQITGMPDSQAQTAINNIIKGSALRDQDSFTDDETYEINYEVTYNSPEIVSIKFDGYSNLPQSAHPNNFMYTLNIDMKKQKEIALKDLVRIDSDFVNKVLNGTYSSQSFEITPEIQASFKDYFNWNDTSFWQGEISKSDTPQSSVCSYLTKDSIYISLPAPHVMGDHIEVIMKYSDLSKFKTGSELWKALSK